MGSHIKNAIYRKYKPRKPVTQVRKERGNKRRNLKRKQRKEELMRLLGNRCKNCGLEGDVAIYDFNHKNPKDKLFNISSRLLCGDDSYFYNYIVPEVEKCVLLCANCHRLLHFGGEPENVDIKRN